jgi:hypothetical protein
MDELAGLSFNKARIILMRASIIFAATKATQANHALAIPAKSFKRA